MSLMDPNILELIWSFTNVLDNYNFVDFAEENGFQRNPQTMTDLNLVAIKVFLKYISRSYQ